METTARSVDHGWTSVVLIAATSDAAICWSVLGGRPLVLGGRALVLAAAADEAAADGPIGTDLNILVDDGVSLCGIPRGPRHSIVSLVLADAGVITVSAHITPTR